MPIRPAVEAAALIAQRWSPELYLAANEERVVTQYFMKASEVAPAINGQLNFRKMGRMAAQALGGSDTGLSLTYNTNIETSVFATPSFIYSGVEIQYATITRMKADLNLQKGYRKQLEASLITQIDATGAQLAAALGTNISGDGTGPLSEDLMLDILGKVIASSRDEWKVGKTRGHFVIHPSQIKYLLKIPMITAAHVRGDSQNPNVKGWVWDAWNCTIQESGNIFVSGGIAHNMLYMPEAFAIGFNQEADVLPPQDVELVVRIIAIAEHGEVELFDEYAGDMQTSVA